MEAHDLSVRKRLAFWLLLIMLTLAVCEAITRVAVGPPGYVRLNQKEDPLYMPDPTRGYTLRPGSHSHYLTPEIDVSIDISSDGLRDTPLADARRSQYRVLAVGDSFTMGLGVAQEDTWCERLEHLLQTQDTTRTASVVNAGVPGYSPRQIRFRLEELFPVVEPHLVIVGLVAETFVRMARPNQLYGGTLIRSDGISQFRSIANRLIYSPFESPWVRGLDFWLNEHFQFGARVIRHSHALYEIARHRLRGRPGDSRVNLDPSHVRDEMRSTFDELHVAKELVERNGVRFLVLLINLQEPDGSFGERQLVYNAMLADHCRREGIVCVDPLPELRRRASGRPIYRTLHDQHWTPAAHAVAAQMLFHAMNDAGAMRRPSVVVNQ